MDKERYRKAHTATHLVQHGGLIAALLWLESAQPPFWGALAAAAIVADIALAAWLPDTVAARFARSGDKK